MAIGVDISLEQRRMGCAQMLGVGLLAVASLPPNLAHPSPDWISCVQNQLNDLGYEARPADGLMGRGTIAAGDAYIAFIKSQYAGRNMPQLTTENADHWCKQVANANQQVAKYYTEILAARGTATLTVTDVTVETELKAGVPYPVSIGFGLVGDGNVNIDEACFTWNGEGPYRFAPETLVDGNINVTLQTGNP
ncbi:MAG: hypothetical protein AAF583_16885 [Pseudomonadota bacterium]